MGKNVEKSQPGGAATVLMDEAGNGGTVGEHERNKLSTKTKYLVLKEMKKFFI